MAHNPRQSTMFDDFAKGVFQASPAIPASGATPATRATSVQAAKSVKSSAASKRMQLLAYVVACGTDGATDEEMQLRCPMAPNTQRPRRRELEAAELICSSGTRLTVSGRTAVVWVATADGRRVCMEARKDGNG